MAGFWDDVIEIGVGLLVNKVKSSMSEETRNNISKNYNNKCDMVRNEMASAERRARRMSDKQLKEAAKNESSSYTKAAYLEELKRRKES